MSLVVETGNGLVNAESFASVADFRAYFANIGTDVTALSDARVEQLLRLGTNFMEQQYRFRWDGYKHTQEQLLSWPRSYVKIKDAQTVLGGFVAYYPFNEIPKPVIYACCELAYRAKDGDLLVDQTQQVLSEEVAGAISVTYDKSSPQQKRYVSIDAWLTPYLKYNGIGGMQMVRC